MLTCGSVDDGKSTLIGRLLYEQKLIFDDQLSALERDSKKFGTTGDDIDFALLVDGLEAEREQGITIDVAYRYFATGARSFIVADTPGHEQYTRNMATGASNADLAIVLVDARKGLLTQTRRHSIIVSLLGIRHVVLAVNKIDLVGYDETIFRDIVAAYRGVRRAARLPLAVRDPDLGALRRQRVVARAPARPGIRARICCDYLERIDVEEDRRSGAVPSAGAMGEPPAPRFPRLSPARSPADGSGAGDPIVVAASGRQIDGRAASRRAIDEGRARRGGRRRHADARRRDRHRARRRAVAARQPPGGRRPVHRAHLIWMSAEPMLPGRSYLMKIGDAHDRPPRSPSSSTGSTSTVTTSSPPSARPERGRLLQSGDDAAGRLRPLCRQPRHRRLHPDRPR